jgi:hypothetical protein
MTVKDFVLARDKIDRNPATGMVMRTPSSEELLREAKQLEEIKFHQWLSEASTKMHDEIAASRRNLGARGLSGSSMGFMAEIHAIFVMIESVIEKAIDFRRDLGARFPTLLMPSELQTLQKRLEQQSDHGIAAVKSRSDLQPRGAGGISAMEEAQNKALGLKARINQKLKALSLEAKLGTNENHKPVTNVFNISNSTISNLNLGTVVGELNSSIQQLATSGRTDLADGFKRVTEAVAASSDLNDEQRKEMLEHLSVVSEETARPPDKRKLGPLKASMGAITSGLSIAAQALTVWQQLEQVLKTAGIIHG